MASLVSSIAEFVESVMNEYRGAIRASGVEVRIDLHGGVEGAKSGTDLESATGDQRSTRASRARCRLMGSSSSVRLTAFSARSNHFGSGSRCIPNLAAEMESSPQASANSGSRSMARSSISMALRRSILVEAHRAVDGAHIEFVGERMARGRDVGGRRFFVFAGSESGEDGVGEIVLQREEVAHVAVDFGGMSGAAFAKLPDLNEDANACPHFLDGAFGDHVDVEFACDLRPLGVAFGVLDDGACGADDEAWRRAKAVGDGVGKCDGEELIFGRRDTELEGNDGDGFAAGGARSLRIIGEDRRAILSAGRFRRHAGGGVRDLFRGSGG